MDGFDIRRIPWFGGIFGLVGGILLLTPFYLFFAVLQQSGIGFTNASVKVSQWLTLGYFGGIAGSCAFGMWRDAIRKGFKVRPKILWFGGFAASALLSFISSPALLCILGSFCVQIWLAMITSEEDSERKKN